MNKNGIVKQMAIMLLMLMGAAGVLRAGTATDKLPASNAIAELRAIAAGPMIKDWRNKVGATTKPAGKRRFLVDAQGDGQTVCTKEIQQAIDECAASGGGIVEFKPGRYVTGSLFIKSNVDFHVAKEVTLLGVQDDAAWPLVRTRAGGIEMDWPAAMINVRNQQNVSISGEGTVNARGKRWWDRFWAAEPVYAKKGLRWAVDYDIGRPHMLQIYQSRDVTVQGLTFIDSPFWTLHTVYSQHVTIEHCTVNNLVAGTKGPSTDGINIDSSAFVLVENCRVDCNDDCLSFKSGINADGQRVNLPVQYCVFRNCVSGQGHGGITLGSDMSGGIRHCEAAGIRMIGTASGIRLKSAAVRGGLVEDVLIHDVQMEKVHMAIEMTMNWFPEFSCPKLPDNGSDIPAHWRVIAEPVPAERRIPTWRDITIADVTGVGSNIGINASGLPQRPMSGYRLERIAISAKTAGGIRCAKDWAIKDVRITGEDGKPVVIKDCTGVSIPETNADNSRPSAKQPGTLESGQRATDVTKGKCWIPKGLNTFEIELQEPKPIIAGDLYSAGEENRAQVTAFHFEAQVNGQWVAILGGRVTANDQLAVRLAFTSAVTASHVRLVIDNGGPDALSHVGDVRLWQGSLDRLPPLEERSKPQCNPVFDLTCHQVFLNQSGFNTQWPKRFTAPISPDDTAFTISPLTDNRILYRGTIKNHVGDFSDFHPDDPHLAYRIALSGQGLKPALSDSFFVAPFWFERVTLDLAAQFFIDARSATGSYPGAFGERAWRDSPYYAYSVPSLVNLYLSNPSLYNQSVVEMNWKRDLTRVLDPGFKLDSYAAGSAMATIRKMFETIDGPVGEQVPDIVQLIHWGTAWNYVQPVSQDFAGSENKVHPEMVSEFAYFLYGLPIYGKYFTPKYINTMRDFALGQWEPAGLFEVNKIIGNFKGRDAPGWTILPNLMMYEFARRKGLANADRFLAAAVAQASWCVENLNLEDPLVTKGQRMSEHKSVSGLVALLRNYPNVAPKGLREHLRKRADVAIRRSENMWDFRKYDDGANWSLPRHMPGVTGGGTSWNEPGNLAGFPFIAWRISLVLGDQPGDEQRMARLNELAVSHFDNLFGRNPLGFHSSWRGVLDFKGVKRGWPVKYRPVCGFLETVRGALNSSAATEHYPFNPSGAFRHPEGWTAFNAALNMGLVAAIQHDSSLVLKREGDVLVIELKAPVFRPTATVSVTQGATTREVELLATDHQRDHFMGSLKPERVMDHPAIKVRYGFGYFSIESTVE